MLISALTALILFMMPWALFGLFVVIKMMLPQRAPMDTSNRINHIRLVWFALTRPEIFVNDFEWLKHDELDNTR